MHCVLCFKIEISSNYKIFLIGFEHYFSLPFSTYPGRFDLSKLVSYPVFGNGSIVERNFAPQSLYIRSQNGTECQR